MTDPAADAAKLLPCPLEDIQILGPNTIGGDSWFGFPQTHGTDNRECTWKDDSGAARLILWFRTWNEAVAFSEALINTRPQPAPPEGEPVAWAVKDFADGWIIYAHEVHARRQAELTGARIERLGLAARPKVEDDPAMVELEVATAAQTLLDSNMKPIAALLERLAGDVQNWWSAAIVAMKAQEAAEAKLAEREAELAKARIAASDKDEMLDALRFANAGLQNQLDAARQQQKDSDESSGG